MDHSKRGIFLVLSFFSLLCFALFYYKYVPLVPSFQVALAPILLVLFTITIIHVHWGIFLFVFLFPLINNLPYLFGIFANTPHAPTALVLFLAFFCGWLVHFAFSQQTIALDHPIFRPLIVFSILASLSALMTFFRYTNFFPFLSPHILELIVNSNSVRTGGAVMNIVFFLLNYLTGFIFLAILYIEIRTEQWRKILLIVLSVSAFLSLLFACFQKYANLSFGNMPYWVSLNQINSTFKDPNAFSVFLSALLPCFLGMLLTVHKKYAKIFYFILIALAFFIFPSIGTRSALLGLVIAFGIFLGFWLSTQKAVITKKFLYGLASLALITGIVLSFAIFSKKSNLYQRLGWSINRLAQKDSADTIFTGKISLWTASIEMMKEYPLTGVGLGAFLVEYPNYSKSLRLSNFVDSAENVFFQAGSELGIIGIVLFLWLFYEIFRQARKIFKNHEGNSADRYLYIGVAAGLAAIFFNFMFHSYIGSFEVKYGFWLLVALILSPSSSEQSPREKRTLGLKPRIVTILLVIIFGIVSLWNSAHSLSLESEAERYGWNQNFGFYEPEKDNRGFCFQWAKKIAGFSIENIGSNLILPVLASHADIQIHPVCVKIYESDPIFKKKRLIKDFRLTKNEWQDIELELNNIKGDKIYLIFETDRSWQPQKYLHVPDPRNLTIGLGKVWFKYPTKYPEDRIQKIVTLASNMWEGPMKNQLWGNGTSSIYFNTENNSSALRLWVRGQSAFNIGPYINVRLDDKIIGRTQITGENLSPLVFMVSLSQGPHKFSVEFVNDFFDSKSGEDRNVFLGNLDILSFNK